MDNGSGVDKTSLWGVLHDGSLQGVQTSREAQTAELKVSVEHLRDFFGWPTESGIRFYFSSVSELKISQWVPDPDRGNEDIRSRRWSRREWDSFERIVPPHSLEILEASLYCGEHMARLELAGYEHDEEGRTDIWLELVVQGSGVTYSTPDGPCDLDRLVQLGDAYWDNVGKKKKR